MIDTAASQLTKTAITVTAIFIVALGYDLWYYVLGYSGVTEYKMNTPIQKIGERKNLDLCSVTKRFLECLRQGERNNLVKIS